MSFVRRIFRIAGIYGLILLIPHYWLEQRIGADDPPAINHPEYFYGFVGIGIAWQIAFLIMSFDPQRHRMLIIPSAIEKFSFGISVFVLHWFGRASIRLLFFGTIDLVLGMLFIEAFRRLGSIERQQTNPQ